MNFSSGSKITLYAPTSGTYEAILVFNDRSIPSSSSGKYTDREQPISHRRGVVLPDRKSEPHGEH
jgi:hypothetical protein